MKSCHHVICSWVRAVSRPPRRTEQARARTTAEVPSVELAVKHVTQSAREAAERPRSTRRWPRVVSGVCDDVPSGHGLTASAQRPLSGTQSSAAPSAGPARKARRHRRHGKRLDEGAWKQIARLQDCRCHVGARQPSSPRYSEICMPYI